VATLPLESLQAFLTAATKVGVAASEGSPVVGVQREDTADHANADVLAGDKTETARHDMGNSNSHVSVPSHGAEDPQRLPADYYVRDGTDRIRNGEGDTTTLATETARAAISAMASAAHREGVVGGSDSMSTAPKGANRNDNSGTQDIQAQFPKPTIDIDLSTAPSDPVDLALWVAKQISHFGEHQRLSTEEDLEEDRPGSQSRQESGHLYNRRQYEDDDNPEKAADRERVRVENRERKKRWRESNAGRSTCHHTCKPFVPVPPFTTAYIGANLYTFNR
jgi:hypothetical protein